MATHATDMRGLTGSPAKPAAAESAGNAEGDDKLKGKDQTTPLPK